MLSKRVIACLDVRDGHLAKSVRFVNTRNIGDPVAKAREYYLDGLDELVFYDITASSDRRKIILDVVEAVAAPGDPHVLLKGPVGVRLVGRIGPDVSDVVVRDGGAAGAGRVCPHRGQPCLAGVQRHDCGSPWCIRLGAGALRLDYQPYHGQHDSCC